MDTVGARLIPGSAIPLVADVKKSIPWRDPTGHANEFDFNGFWDVADPTLLTIPVGFDGIYHITAKSWFLSSATAARYMRILVNGSTPVADSRITTPAFSASIVGGDWRLVAGDTLELELFSERDVNVINLAISLVRIFKE